jgi:diadenosine tetraphosphate (Ap4A) HIT family hydrolase
MTDFVLDPRLEADSLPVAEWPLCQVRLIDDARFPWLILVPQRPDISEILDLDPDDRRQLTAEIDRAAIGLRRAVGCHKLNVAALGNVVAQLHVHVIARTRSDAAWPKPVWGQGHAQPYDEAGARDLIGRIAAAFAS